MSAAIQPYINDEDQIIENVRYYYYVKVTDTDGNNISGASISASNMDRILLTPSSGEVKWTEPTRDLFQVTVTCPGYETSEPIKIRGRENGYPSSPIKTIELTKKSVSGYHYKITVKDKDDKLTAISGARIYIYKEDGTIEDDDVHNQTQSDGSFVYYSEAASILNFVAKKNGYEDGACVAEGSQSTPIPMLIWMKKTVVADYYYVISVRDSAGNPVPNVGFRLYTDLAYTISFSEAPNEIFTNSNGIASVHLGHISYLVRDLYVKGTTIPPGYEWTTSTGRLQATLSATDPGCSFVLQSYISFTTYYYNFKVVNSMDETTVSDVQVSFYDGDTLLATKTTNSNGVAFYSTNYQNLKVKISKSGFDTGYETGISLSGNSVSTSYRKVIITPKNTIRVLFDDYSPAVGVKVDVFKYDQDRNMIYIRKGESTHAGGYLEPIDEIYYSTALYAKIPNYSTTIWPINPGPMVIQIPKYTNDNEDTEQEKHYNKLSINGMKRSMDAGSVDYGNSTDYAIRILDPDVVTTMDIFTSTPVMMYSDKKNVIGSVDVNLKPDVNDLRLKMLNRYSGYYNPIFKDILFYKNLQTETGKECKYSNTSFQADYKDNYGRFGIINNMWFHKVNDNPDVEIFNTLTPYYPLTGEYALDCKDYNIFSSNWDMNYFTRQIDKDNSELCQNIGSMKNGLCMFGSKYLNVPNTIQIMGLTIGDTDWDGEWNDDWITNPNGCPGELMYKEVNNNSVDFYFFFTKRIVRFFKDKLKGEFEKYITPNLSYGKEGLDDDIEEYVRKNVLKLYKLEKVIMFVRRTKKGQHNSRIENDYTSYLEYDPDTSEPCDVGYYRKHGFVEVNTVTMTKMNRDDFDRKLVYNLRNGSQEDFGFGFILKKI